jgi:hypothetical protein
MNKLNKILLIILVVVLGLSLIPSVFAAGDEPVADAGINKEVVEGNDITLDGSGSSSDMNYSWSCNGGTLSNSDTLTPVFTAPSVTMDTTYMCTLTVSDSHTSNRDVTNVLVLNDNESNIAPVVNAGNDVSVDEGNQAVLAGTASDANAGDILNYNWSCNGGTLSNSDTLTPVFTAPSVTMDTTYMCTFTASDGELSSSDMVNVLVNNLEIPQLVVITEAANNINSTTAKLNGDLRDLGGSSEVEVWFEWGTTDSYGNVTTKTSLSNTGSFDTDLSGLSSNTLYHFRSVAENDTLVRFGVDRTFTTNSSGGGGIVYVSGGGSHYYGGNKINNPPTIDAGSILTVTEGESVTILANSYDPEGDYLTYEWSCDGGILSDKDILQPEFRAPSVTELETYTCEVVVRDVDNNADSDSTVIFVNDSVTKARVKTKNATNVENNSAKLNGEITSLGGSENVTVWFEWGRGASYDYETQKVTKTDIGEFSVVLNNLVREGLYNYRTIIENEKGIYYGGNNYFKTGDEDTKNYPNVNAGPDRSVYEREAINLSGSAIDHDGRVTLNSWGCLLGKLQNGNTTNPRYTAPDVDKNTYDTCVFSATDNEGQISSDSMVILIKDSGYVNAGSLIDFGEEEVQLLSIEKWVRNVSRGDKEWRKDQIEAQPSDEVEFKIEISSLGDEIVRDISVKDSLPIELIYQNNLKVDGREDIRDVTEEEINVGDLSTGKTRTLVFSAKVKSEEDFDKNNTNLITSAIVFNNEDSESDTASVLVKKPFSLLAALSFGLIGGGFSVYGFLSFLFVLLVLILLYLFFSKKYVFAKRVDIK